MADITIGDQTFSVRAEYVDDLQPLLDELAERRAAPTYDSSELDALRSELAAAHEEHEAAVKEVAVLQAERDALAKEVADNDTRAEAIRLDPGEALACLFADAKDAGLYPAVLPNGSIHLARRSDPHLCPSGTLLRSKLVREIWPGGDWREG